MFTLSRRRFPNAIALSGEWELGQFGIYSRCKCLSAESVEMELFVELHRYVSKVHIPRPKIEREILEYTTKAPIHIDDQFEVTRRQYVLPDRPSDTLRMNTALPTKQLP